MDPLLIKEIPMNYFLMLPRCDDVCDISLIDIAEISAIPSNEFTRIDFNESAGTLTVIMKVGDPICRWYPKEAYQKLKDVYFYNLHRIATNDLTFNGVIRLDVILQEVIDNA